MQRYWWPSYAQQLLTELQKQQNSSQFCDTLLQTEGISVPAHSCILAALSPQLSQRLSASPTSPSGHRRKVRLDTMTAQTLLKMVGLLYSGEMEVKGSLEKDEVLYAARQFGITNLVEGQKETQDGHFDHGQAAADCPHLKTRGVSVGTQTPRAEENTADIPLSHSGQNHPPVTVPSSVSGAPRDGDSSGAGSSAPVASPASLSRDSDSQAPQELISCQREGPMGPAIEPSNRSEKSGAELNESSREEPLQEGDGPSTGTDNQAKMKISFKLKLVRTEGKAWEVLNRGDAHEEAALTSTRPRSRGNNLLETVDFTDVPEGVPISRKMIRDVQINGGVAEREGERQLREKRKRVEREEEEIPVKKAGTADREGVNEKSDRIPAGANPDGPREARGVNVKDVQKILRHLRTKTRKLKGRRSRDATGDEGNLQRVETEDSSVLKGQDKDATEPQTGSRESPLTGHSVDRNHNHILSPITPRQSQLSKENRRFCAAEDVLLAADELLGPLIHCVPRRRGQTCWDQGPEPLQSSEESQGSPQLSDPVSSPSETSALVIHDQSSIQTPNRNSPPLNSNCHQEEEEEEEEEEVDILCYSPLADFSLTGNEQLNMDVFPEEEEEEEDQSEINVMDA